MTVATIVSVTGGAISLSVPMVQSGPTNVPCEGVADTSVSPADSTSVTTRPVAGLGPLFCHRHREGHVFAHQRRRLVDGDVHPDVGVRLAVQDGRGDVVAGHGVGLVLIEGPGPDS